MSKPHHIPQFWSIYFMKAIDPYTFAKTQSVVTTFKSYIGAFKLPWMSSDNNVNVFKVWKIYVSYLFQRKLSFMFLSMLNAVCSRTIGGLEHKNR